MDTTSIQMILVSIICLSSTLDKLLWQLTYVWTSTWQLFLEPALRTNRPKKKLLHSEPPEERIYEPEGVGVMLKKGDEVRKTK